MSGAHKDKDKKSQGQGQNRIRSRLRGTTSAGVRSGTNRYRESSEETEPMIHPIEPSYVLDKLQGCLSKDENLLHTLIQHLFKLSNIQTKITEQMSQTVKSASFLDIDANGEIITSETAKTLVESV